MFAKSLMGVFVLSTGLMHVACGKKDKAEEVNISNLELDSDKPELHRGSALGIKGKVEGNTPYVMSFSITDSEGNDVPFSDSNLKVEYKRPPSGRTHLTLQEHMQPRLVAGDEVCNGKYAVNVTAKVGKAVASKPLYFEVKDGLPADAPQCVRKKNNKKAELISRQGTIHNLIGTKPGAFDLEKGENVAQGASDETKDLIDMTAETSTKMSLKFKSLNGARFAHTVGLDYMTASHADAEQQTQVHALHQTTESLKQDDVYVVKMSEARGGAYYLLRITKAQQNNKKRNDGYINFEYRKL